MVIRISSLPAKPTRGLDGRCGRLCACAADAEARAGSGGAADFRNPCMKFQEPLSDRILSESIVDNCPNLPLRGELSVHGNWRELMAGHGLDGGGSTICG